MRCGEKISYLEGVTWRCHGCDRKEKGKILDEFCAFCLYSCKYAVQSLKKGNVPIKQKPRGRKIIFDKEIILPHLPALWLATDTYWIHGWVERCKLYAGC